MLTAIIILSALLAILTGVLVYTVKDKRSRINALKRISRDYYNLALNYEQEAKHA